MKLALGTSLHHSRSPFGSAVRLRFILQTISKEIDMKTLGELLRDKINASIDAKLVEELDALSRPAEHEHSAAKYEQNN